MIEYVVAHEETIGAALIAVVGGPLMSWLMARRTEKQRRRISQSEQEGVLRLDFIAQMQHSITTANTRISELETAIARGFARERSLTDRYDQRERELDRRWRHLANNLIMYSVALTEKLRQAGIEVPPFRGFEQFIREGGELRAEWRRDDNDQPVI